MLVAYLDLVAKFCCIPLIYCIRKELVPEIKMNCSCQLWATPSNSQTSCGEGKAKLVQNEVKHFLIEMDMTFWSPVALLLTTLSRKVGQKDNAVGKQVEEERVRVQRNGFDLELELKEAC